jgi:hypothetical protein
LFVTHSDERDRADDGAPRSPRASVSRVEARLPRRTLSNMSDDANDTPYHITGTIDQFMTTHTIIMVNDHL